MKTRVTSFLVIVMLLISTLATAPPVLASATTNLAGRPITGYADEWCQGTAYGRVDGSIVLFTAAHCRPNGGAPGSSNGVAVKNISGQTIGTFWETGGVSVYDMAYIKLNAGFVPSNPNQIFAGDLGNNGTDNWWTITYKWGHSAFACPSIDSYFGSNGTIYHNFQQYILYNEAARSGTILGYWGAYNGTAAYCQVRISQTRHVGYKDSGSSFIITAFNGAVAGVGTAYCSAGCAAENIIITPWRAAITTLGDYWDNHGTMQGAWFCINTACT